MQAWQQVKVSNGESQHAGRAGYVVRVERVGDAVSVQVKLDDVSEVIAFDAAELSILS